MTPDPSAQARTALAQALQALQEKRVLDARTWAQQAVRLDPTLDEAWLILAAFSEPEESIQYLKRALAINPQNERARRGMHWAIQRLRKEPGAPSTLEVTARLPIVPAAITQRVTVVPPAVRRAQPGAQPRRTPAALPWMALAVVLLVGLFALFITPLSRLALAHYSSAERPRGVLLKPSLTATATVTQTPSATPTATATLTFTPTFTASPTATFTTTAVPTNTPKPTRTPETTSTPPPTVVVYDPPPVEDAPAPPPGTSSDRWVDVNLSAQTAAAYEGDTLVRSFVVSTGTSAHPTVTGQFSIYVMYRYADMAGPGYYLPDVPYVMYFYKGYGLHGTYWHNNFGVPMSHGCVNFSIDDAAWLFDFVSIGTLVNVHY